ncbi:hypothetical protein A1C_04285 [Rickettsia akari str. Hartford]|uniref:Uncharacterized protein n=1 Tax=Rickettsia akari (strain Hartford) TaxID=293614 RepID=A8GP04_RICAH|nr:hypothetical protein A1C_04285 [Rickettsia akari str. Hartford]
MIFTPWAHIQDILFQALKNLIMLLITMTHVIKQCFIQDDIIFCW